MQQLAGVNDSGSGPFPNEQWQWQEGSQTLPQKGVLYQYQAVFVDLLFAWLYHDILQLLHSGLCGSL
jgi:hypothetical protein